MKKLLIIGLILFGTQATFAQQDVKAKAVLDKLSAKAKTFKTISATFMYELNNPTADINEKQEGSLISKGEKYNLNIAGQNVISDGKTKWTYIADAEEVQIDDATTEGEEALNPSKILTIYEDGFKYKYDKDITENGRTIQVVKLFPEKADEKPYHSALLYVDKVKNEVTKIELKGKDGSNYIYTITSFEVNKEIPDSKFVFNTAKHPEVEVIDLR